MPKDFKPDKWRFSIDRGGTFTDVVATPPQGAPIVRKLLSKSAHQYEDAALEGIRRILDDAGADLEDVGEVRVGTTVATNALLERKGVRVAFVTTEGFADALAIGHQARPNIFALNVQKPGQFYERVIEVRERISATGDVLRVLDEDHVRAALSSAFEDGFRSVAIAFMHAWASPKHEERVREIARGLGFTQITTSAETSGLIKFIPRAGTAVIDAYLSPVVRQYVDRFAAPLAASNARLLFMQSNGGLTGSSSFRGRDAVLSGPAGGVVAAVVAGKRAGYERVLGFDMGGTSTDVCHFAGDFERSAETEVAGARFSAPMLQVHTVAAGGGSVCTFDGARLRVGPHSAGADPGPAAYRRGGPLTITDCNILLGRIRPEYFPAIFGPQGDLPLDKAIVEKRFADLSAAVESQTGKLLSPHTLALGFIEIANLDMARAIKRISIERGYDPAEYALVAFGGAGGQHACAVADAVGANTIVLHPFAGVLSAWGIGLADMRAMVIESADIGLDSAAGALGRAQELGERAAADLLRQGSTPDRIELRAHLKYEGAETTLPIPLEDSCVMQAKFEGEHEKRFGFKDTMRAVQISAISAEAICFGGNETQVPTERKIAPMAIASHEVEVWTQSRAQRVPLFSRSALPRGFSCVGPAIVLESGATTFVDADWRLAVNESDDIILTRATPRSARGDVAAEVDPIQLEVFNNRFMAVAEEMGLALQATASSVNIKERLDFSCALFDASGALVANAPHIPVHLGSMSESVREVLRAHGDRMGPGDAYVLNAPHAGGTHLPDITIVAPIFLDSLEHPAFFTAARGHHADIGGVTPGSMPPTSRRLADEGVVIEPSLLVDRGRFNETAIRQLLASSPYPARDPDRNIADLKAQIAACFRGGDEIRRLASTYSPQVVAAYMKHVQSNAAEQIRRVIDRLKPGAMETPLDIGATISVRIHPDHERRRLVVDFTGTSAQHESNFNAPPAIARAAVLYVFRTLVSDPIPLNDGCLEPLDILIPDGSLLCPRPGAAVVAGNVETSQVIVDVLYGVLGALAASQGTMNNFTFGDATHQYYETICGGAGAGPDFCGASAVQTHMTNSRLTDPEVLETRFPVLVESFSIRRGSGGDGLRRGGDGVERRIQFLAPLTAAVLANRRSTRPFGILGGADGLPGANWVERADGELVKLGSTAVVDMRPGDIFVIQTPGGGGYGKAADT
jgi:5-oxoprolinase (ATP-hydrolysing)